MFFLSETFRQVSWVAARRFGLPSLNGYNCTQPQWSCKRPGTYVAIVKMPYYPRHSVVVTISRMGQLGLRRVVKLSIRSASRQPLFSATYHYNVLTGRSIFIPPVET